METNKINYVWGLLRLAMGWTFLWAFLDKLIGLGFTTLPEKAWLAGGSPTFGFLKFATKGPFVEFYQSLAGNGLVDFLFMAGLLFVGISLLFGIFTKLGSFSGALILILMYSAGFIPPEHNPFLDDHIINALIMLGLLFSHSGRYLGFGNWWSNTKLVRKYSIFE